MSVHVVIPATRPCNDLLWSLQRNTRLPDAVIIVSNEVTPQGPSVGVVRFFSGSVPIGWGDAGLRRDIGADVSDADILIFLDDDLLAPEDLVESAVDIVERDGLCWGHHRYIDFDAHSREALLRLPPEEGHSREDGVNRWHGWQSSYAGLLAIRRDLFWEVGGFDLAYLGHHGNEDQQLGRRLGKAEGYRTYVHEPPFAWHPSAPRFHATPRSNTLGTHQMETVTINGHQFSVCGECPCRYPLDVDRLTMSEEVVIPYSREALDIEKETSWPSPSSLPRARGASPPLRTSSPSPSAGP